MYPSTSFRTRRHARHAWLAGIPAAALCLAAHAAARVQVQTPATFAADSSITEAARDECHIDRVVAEQVTSALRGQFAGVQPATDERHASGDPFLRLAVLWVVGGSHPGVKSIGVRAELVQEGRVVASEQFRESSVSGLTALAGSPCEKFAEVAKGVGEEVAGWLPEVTALEALPKRPASKRPSAARAPAPLQHEHPVPPASGYAAVDDFDAVPLREQGKARYRHYLTLQPPKAFVISENGSWVMTATDKAAVDKSLGVCVLRGYPCWLYAVDDQVVWQPDLARRTGRAAAAEPPRAQVARAPAAATAASAIVVPGVAAETPPRAHRFPPPAASGFASADDVDAMPLSSTGKQRYRHFLTLPAPRAFVIYEGGGWRFAANSPDAMTEVLDHCARQGTPCWLYAVDDRVVWNREPALRIGTSAQVRGKPAVAAAPR